MLPQRGTPIEITTSSMIDLKAELAKKRDEFTATKAAHAKPPPIRRKAYRGGKRQSDGEVKTSQSNLTPPSDDSDDDSEMLAKSRLMLQKKSDYYDAITEGDVIPPPGDDNCVVDFEKIYYEKKRAKMAAYSNVAPTCAAATDKESCIIDGESLYRSVERADVSQTDDVKSAAHYDALLEDAEGEDKVEVHYEDLREGEVREHGVGYFKFSRDEAKREQQMQNLDDMRRATSTSQVKRDRILAMRAAQKKTRLEKIRKARGLVTASSTTTLPQHEENAGGVSVAGGEEVLPPAPDDELTRKLRELRDASEQDKAAEERAVRLKTMFTTREWDQPKTLMPASVQHFEKLRSEREPEFAPPQNYRS